MNRSLRIVCLLFPGVTQLDLTGPAQIFSRLPDTELSFAWHRIEPVLTDAGFAIVPTTTLTAAPQADVLFVPGGQGAFELSRMMSRWNSCDARARALGMSRVCARGRSLSRQRDCCEVSVRRATGHRSVCWSDSVSPRLPSGSSMTATSSPAPE